MKFLKNTSFLLAALIGCTGISNAQYSSKKDADDFLKNNFKLNLLALPLRSVSIQYERGFSRKISAALSLRLQPYGHVPLKSAFKAAYNGLGVFYVDDYINNSFISSSAVTAEGRYYFGKRPLNGLYVAPFLRYGNYHNSWIYDFRNDDSVQSITEVSINGRVRGFTAGLLIGAQWHFRNRWLIDWWIAGPSYGRMNLLITGEGGIESLKVEDKARLEYSIKSTTIGGSSFDAKLEGNTITVTGSVPFPGIRFGLCLGYSF